MGQGVVRCSFVLLGGGVFKKSWDPNNKNAQRKNKQKNGKLLMLWVVSFFLGGGVISAVVDVKLLGAKCVSFACRNWFLLEMGETRKVGLIVNHGSIHKRFKSQSQIRK